MRLTKIEKKKRNAKTKWHDKLDMQSSIDTEKTNICSVTLHRKICIDKPKSKLK